MIFAPSGIVFVMLYSRLLVRNSAVKKISYWI